MDGSRTIEEGDLPAFIEIAHALNSYGSDLEPVPNLGFIKFRFGIRMNHGHQNNEEKYNDDESLHGQHLCSKYDAINLPHIRPC